MSRTIWKKKMSLSHARWGLILLPLLPSVLLIRASTPSPTVVDQTIDISGNWAVEVDGETRSMVVPRLGQDLPSEVELALTKEFVIDELWSGPSFLLLGNTASGVFRVFLNDVEIGSEAIQPRTKCAYYCFFSRGFSTSLLRKGSNRLTLRGRWPTDWRGLSGPQLRVGPALVLAPFSERFENTWQLLIIGSGAIFLVGFVLLSVISLLTDAVSRKATQLGALMCGSLVLSIFFNDNPGALFSSAYIERFVVFFAALGANLMTWLVHEMFAPRLRWVARGYTVCVAVAALIYLIPGSYLYGAVAFRILSIGVIISMLAVAVRILLPSIRRGNVMCVGLAMGSCLAALLSLAQMLNINRIFGVVLPDPGLTGLFAGGIIALMVVLQDFLEIVRTNQTLAASLHNTNVSLQTTLHRVHQSSRLKDEMLARVSHELRTPLNSIINIPILMRESFATEERVECRSCQAVFVLDKDERFSEDSSCPECNIENMQLTHVAAYHGENEPIKQLDLVQRSGERLLRLVDDLLSLSKLNAASRESRIVEPVCVYKVLASVQEQFHSIATGRGISLEFSSVEASVFVMANDDLLFRLVCNLLDNAIKFSSDGDTVSVTSSKQERHFVIVVEDSGPGISNTHLEQIFDAFFQVDGGRTRSHGGAGLGLSIVQSLATEMGSEVSVSSKLGVGSAFTVRVPLVEEVGLQRDEPEENTRGESARAAADEGDPLGGP